MASGRATRNYWRQKQAKSLICEACVSLSVWRFQLTSGNYRLAGSSTGETILTSDAMPEDFDEAAFEEFFGLCATEELVIIRPYSGDEDDRLLDELRPRYVVMYDPDPAFIRRVEVRSTTDFLGCV